MKVQYWIPPILILLTVSSCGDAFEAKPKVVDKRSHSGSSDATPGRSVNTEKAGGDTSPEPGSSVISVVPGVSLPGEPEMIIPPSGGGVIASAPPVVTTNSQTLTLANSCYKGDLFLCQIEIALANRTNTYRAALGPLEYSSGVAWVARDWSNQQAVNNSLGHGGFPTARYAKYQAEFGMNAAVNFSAENVAYAYGTSASAEVIADELMALWLSSSGHRDNILGNFRTLGIGVSKTGNYFYGTQLFGK